MRNSLVYKDKSNGYTLIELSMVMLIIGLIIAAIYNANSFVRQAQYRAVVIEVNNFKSAINLFNLQFNQFPGDITNAYNLWGNNSIYCTNATTGDESVGNNKCNGNGDGIVMAGLGEGVKAWFHLSQAGMLTASYSGTYVVAGQNDLTNSPGSKFAPAIYYMNSYWPPIGDGGIFLVLGGQQSGAHPTGLVLTPTDAYNIDVKTDDGIPASGKVSGADSTGNPGNCYTNFPNTYSINNTLINCIVGFQIK